MAGRTSALPSLCVSPCSLSQGQRGGRGEPFYYDSEGLGEAVEVLTEAGKEVFRRKWGHDNCDLIGGAGLGFDDQWKVLKDF